MNIVVRRAAVGQISQWLGMWYARFADDMSIHFCEAFDGKVESLYILVCSELGLDYKVDV